MGHSEDNGVDHIFSLSGNRARNALVHEVVNDSKVRRK